MATDETTAADEDGASADAAGTASTDPAAAESAASGAAAPLRRSAPAAAAASRARRIGGRVAPPGAAAPARPSDPAAGTDDVGTDPAVGADPEATPGSNAEPRTRRLNLRKTPPVPLAGSDGGDDPAVGAATAVPARPRSAQPAPDWLRWLPATVLAVGVIVTLVLLVALSHGVWWAKPSAATERAQVLAAAKECTVLTNSYNYKTFSADEKKGLACTTGKYTADYRSAMENVLRPSVTKLKASQAAQINDAGVESITDDGSQWTILIYGQFAVNNTNLAKTGRIDPFGAVVRVQRVSGKWRIVKVDSAAG